jgi:hypothetical protein
MSRSDGNVRTLVLPDGGTLTIPLPGSKARFAHKPGGLLAESESRTVPTLLIGIVLGAAVGAGVAVWCMRRS